MRRILLFFNLFLLFLFSAGSISAFDGEAFITVVNPVRISSYTKDSTASLTSQYVVVKERGLPATWLLTSDVLGDQRIMRQIAKMDKNQEFGIFLEVTQKFSERAGVAYHNTGFWYHATSVFLSGYTQNERRLLMDEVFRQFKEIFGYYPTAVGSWWTDSYSLAYLKEKYGVTVNLTCSDQFSTDGYRIWGQPWSIPYYPSKYFSATPASSNDAKIGVVNIQWASRDLLNGYESSLYSLQDYLLAPQPQDINYFKKLVDFYLNLGQVTVGLEADLDSGVYDQQFLKQMDYVLQKKNEGISVVTMSKFADWYMKKYSDLSPEVSFESEDLLGRGIKAYWYLGKKYRLFYTKDDQNIKIRDFRIYNSEMNDPYYISPNYFFDLGIDVPYVISESEFPESVWVLPKDAEVIPGEDGILLRGKIVVPKEVGKSDLINLKRNRGEIEILPSENLPKVFGQKIKGYSSEAIHFFKRKRAVIDLIRGVGWNYFKKVNYQIPQGEEYALLFLKSLPNESVMVYDGECLQCSYHSELKPPFFANLRDYVKNISQHKIVYNSSVFNSKTRNEAKSELIKTKARYVYLVSFEGYSEQLPYSPGDLGVEKIFDNANAEIWRVK